jgi:hypothetical protein
MWRSTRIALVGVLVTTVTVVGCDWSDLFFSISVEPTHVEMAVGDTVLLRAVVRRGDGYVESRPVTWAVRDTSVVMLSDTGTVDATEHHFQAKAVGTTHVIVSISTSSYIRDSAIVIVR